MQNFLRVKVKRAGPVYQATTNKKIKKPDSLDKVSYTAFIKSRD